MTQPARWLHGHRPDLPSRHLLDGSVLARDRRRLGLAFGYSIIYSDTGMVDAISPESYLTVAQAARRLGISARRVNHLVGTGDLRSSQLGAITVIPVADVERRRSLKPGDGRRLTASNAWGVLALASSERPSWLAADTRYRLGRLLAKHGLVALRARLMERGERQAFRAHPSLLRAIRDDPALMLTGVTAAAELRLGLLAGETVDAYVDERALATLIARYRLRESKEPNVILRVVPSFTPSWPPSHIAPRAAVALDLIEDDDPRIRQVGTQLLGRLTG